MFETNRLTLRGWRPSDMDAFLAMLSDYDVLAPMVPTYIVPSIREIQALVESWVSLALFVVVEKKESGEFVGMAALKIDIPKNADAELGICLVKKCWGQGYGTEIMEWLVGYGFKGMALHRLSLGVFSFNNRALSLYKHLGFTVEGVKREAVWFEGKRADIMWMGLLKAEYEEKCRAAQA